MIKNFQVWKYCLFLFGLMSLPLSAFGQDLGSSSGLFSSPKSKTIVKTPPRKAAPKLKKTVAAIKKTAPKISARAARNTNQSKVVGKLAAKTSLLAEQTTRVPPVKVNLIITVGDKSTGDYNEFFERAIEEGDVARDARQYTKAEAAYLRAQSIKVKDSRSNYGLGNLYRDQKRWEEAERAYRTAIEFEPMAPEAHIALSSVLTQSLIGGNLAYRYTEAKKLARRAIALDSKNALAYDQLGVALELSGIISQETQNAYRKAIELEPTFALAYVHLGRLLQKTGSANESAAAYRRAIENSIDVPTMILVAEVFQSQQKFVESEQLLRRALNEDKKNPAALFLLGRALTMRGSYEEAEKVLKKSAEVSPTSFVSYTLLGSLSIRREKYKDAENYLMNAARLVSPQEKRHLAHEFEAVGDGFMRVGKKRDAARVFRQAAALDKEKTILARKLAKAQIN